MQVVVMYNCGKLKKALYYKAFSVIFDYFNFSKIDI